MGILGTDCLNCDDASDSFTVEASVPSNPDFPDCEGDAHVTKSDKQKICKYGTWNGTLTIEGYDCCDSVDVVLTDENGSEEILTTLGSDGSSATFSFDVPECGLCGKDWYLQVITSDEDGCSQGWTGTVDMEYGGPLP